MVPSTSARDVLAAYRAHGLQRLYLDRPFVQDHIMLTYKPSASLGFRQVAWKATSDGRKWKKNFQEVMNGDPAYQRGRDITGTDRENSATRLCPYRNAWELLRFIERLMGLCP